MKRAERQRLKQNDLGELTRQAQEALAGRTRDLAWVAGIVVAVGAVALGYWAWQQNIRQGAQKLLADAMVVQEARIGPPAAATGQTGLTFPTERERAQAALTKFKAVADAYPSTDEGLYARYQEGSTQIVLGNPGEAAKAYQVVIDRAGSRLIGETARLGLAAAHARGGQFDQAITTYKELAQKKDGGLPIDGILMELGRVYRDAGRAGEAQQTFNRLIEEFPASPFNADAKRELDALKKPA
jgi:tetratricopeptide (TPR) repeat protein